LTILIGFDCYIKVVSTNRWPEHFNLNRSS